MSLDSVKYPARNRADLLAACRRERPSRVPFTYDGLAETNRRLREYLGLEDCASLPSYFECNIIDSPWGAFGSGPSLPERTARNRELAGGSPDVRTDIWGVRRELKKAGAASYWEITEHPLARAESAADVEKYDWPRPDELRLPEPPADFNLAEWKRDRFVLDMGWICPFGVPWAMRGLESFMMDCALNPEIVEALVAKTEEFSLGCMKIILDKYPGLTDAAGCGDDYGTQNGLMISPEAIRFFFMPSLKRHYDLARRHGLICYHHCCGAIMDAIPLMIDAGLQVLNPVQTSAAGMDPAELKKRFGRDLCFHGSVDIQQTLLHGSEAEVRAEVRHRIDTLGPEGFILAPSHVLQPDIPPQNIAAMYGEAKAYGAGR